MKRQELTNKAMLKLSKQAALSVNLWQELLSNTRYLSMFYQTAHWLSKGNNSYEDHLLFERIYNSVDEQIDGIAERSIGTTGDKAVELQAILEKLLDLHKKDPFELSKVFETALKLEKQHLDLLKKMNDDKEISIGTQDFINSLAGEHEVNVYLLQQRAK